MEDQDMTETPQTGDKAKITIEGTVRGHHTGGLCVEVGTDNSLRLACFAITPDRAVEVIKPAGPTWQSGDVVSCEHGFTYLRSDGGLWLNTMGNEVKGPEHPLTLIARHGKPVSSAAQS